MAGKKVMPLQKAGLKQQVQLRGVHVGVAPHFVLSQGGQSRHQAGLAGAALAAQHGQFIINFYRDIRAEARSGGFPRLSRF
jgi:hypothetical protein